MELGQRMYLPGCRRLVCKTFIGMPIIEEQFCDPLPEVVPDTCFVSHRPHRRHPDCCPSVVCSPGTPPLTVGLPRIQLDPERGSPPDPVVASGLYKTRVRNSSYGAGAGHLNTLWQPIPGDSKVRPMPVTPPPTIYMTTEIIYGKGYSEPWDGSQPSPAEEDVLQVYKNHRYPEPSSSLEKEASLALDSPSNSIRTPGDEDGIPTYGQGKEGRIIVDEDEQKEVKTRVITARPHDHHSRNHTTQDTDVTYRHFFDPSEVRTSPIPYPKYANHLPIAKLFSTTLLPKRLSEGKLITESAPTTPVVRFTPWEAITKTRTTRPPTANTKFTTPTTPGMSWSIREEKDNVSFSSTDTSRYYSTKEDVQQTTPPYLPTRRDQKKTYGSSKPPAQAGTTTSAHDTRKRVTRRPTQGYRLTKRPGANKTTPAPRLSTDSTRTASESYEFATPKLNPREHDIHEFILTPLDPSELIPGHDKYLESKYSAMREYVDSHSEKQHPKKSRRSLPYTDATLPFEYVTTLPSENPSETPVYSTSLPGATDVQETDAVREKRGRPVFYIPWRQKLLPQPTTPHSFAEEHEDESVASTKSFPPPKFEKLGFYQPEIPVTIKSLINDLPGTAYTSISLGSADTDTPNRKTSQILMTSREADFHSSQKASERPNMNHETNISSEYENKAEVQLSYENETELESTTVGPATTHATVSSTTESLTTVSTNEFLTTVSSTDEFLTTVSSTDEFLTTGSSTDDEFLTTGSSTDEFLYTVSSTDEYSVTMSPTTDSPTMLSGLAEQVTPRLTSFDSDDSSLFEKDNETVSNRVNTPEGSSDSGIADYYHVTSPGPERVDIPFPQYGSVQQQPYENSQRAIESTETPLLSDIKSTGAPSLSDIGSTGVPLLSDIRSTGTPPLSDIGSARAPPLSEIQKTQKKSLWSPPSFRTSRNRSQSSVVRKNHASVPYYGSYPDKTYMEVLQYEPKRHNSVNASSTKLSTFEAKQEEDETMKIVTSATFFPSLQPREEVEGRSYPTISSRPMEVETMPDGVSRQNQSQEIDVDVMTEYQPEDATEWTTVDPFDIDDYGYTTTDTIVSRNLEELEDSTAEPEAYTHRYKSLDEMSFEINETFSRNSTGPEVSQKVQREPDSQDVWVRGPLASTSEEHTAPPPTYKERPTLTWMMGERPRLVEEELPSSGDRNDDDHDDLFREDLPGASGLSGDAGSLSEPAFDPKLSSDDYAKEENEKDKTSLRTEILSMLTSVDLTETDAVEESYTPALEVNVHPPPSDSSPSPISRLYPIPLQEIPQPQQPVTTMTPQARRPNLISSSTSQTQFDSQTQTSPLPETSTTQGPTVTERIRISSRYRSTTQSTTQLNLQADPLPSGNHQSSSTDDQVEVSTQISTSAAEDSTSTIISETPTQKRTGGRTKARIPAGRRRTYSRDRVPAQTIEKSKAIPPSRLSRMRHPTTQGHRLSRVTTPQDLLVSLESQPIRNLPQESIRSRPVYTSPLGSSTPNGDLETQPVTKPLQKSTRTRSFDRSPPHSSPPDEGVEPQPITKTLQKLTRTRPFDRSPPHSSTPDEGVEPQPITKNPQKSTRTQPFDRSPPHSSPPDEGVETQPITKTLQKLTRTRPFDRSPPHSSTPDEGVEPQPITKTLEKSVRRSRPIYTSPLRPTPLNGGLEPQPIIKPIQGSPRRLRLAHTSPFRPTLSNGGLERQPTTNPYQESSRRSPSRSSSLSGSLERQPITTSLQEPARSSGPVDTSPPLSSSPNAGREPQPIPNTPHDLNEKSQSDDASRPRSSSPRGVASFMYKSMIHRPALRQQQPQTERPKRPRSRSSIRNASSSRRGSSTSSRERPTPAADGHHPTSKPPPPSTTFTSVDSHFEIFPEQWESMREV
ncbi:uncharacterized protein [Panulirus ornatus]